MGVKKCMLCVCCIKSKCRVCAYVYVCVRISAYVCARL